MRAASAWHIEPRPSLNPDQSGTAEPRLVVIPAGRASSNHEGVAREIGIAIITGRYAEDSKLPGDAELTEQFKISRPVLRESIKTLVAKGLLTTKPRVGTVVRQRSAWNMFDPEILAWHLDAGVGERFLQDLAEIRLAVEPRAAALAAKRRTDADLAAMDAALALMRRTASDKPEFAEADLNLHIAVANASANPFMCSISAVIEAALRASFILSAPRDAQRDEVIEAHERIVDAIRAGEAEEAAAALTYVIFNGLRRRNAKL